MGWCWIPAGRPIPNSRVNVFARDRQLRITTVADAEGKYSVDALPAGQYLVQADAPGMARRVATAIAIGGNGCRVARPEIGRGGSADRGRGHGDRIGAIDR